MIYLQLFIEFFRAGLFSIGGGLATLPFLQDIAVRRGWFTLDELTNMIAVAESTPGPIGINMSTYAGYRTAGITGSLVATFSLVLPSFIVMLLIACALGHFHENRYVKSVLHVLRPASVAMVAAAVYEVLKAVFLNTEMLASASGIFAAVKPLSIALYAVMLAVYLGWNKLHPLVLIAAGAVIGLMLPL